MQAVTPRFVSPFLGDCPCSWSKEVSMDELLTTSDVARALNRSVDSVRDYERNGKLPAQKTRSGQRLFRIADVELLAKQLKDRT
jgi:hypothetical protein